MGADLCTFIVVGKEKMVMTDEMLTEIKATSVEYIEILKKYITAQELTEEEQAFIEFYEETFGDDPMDAEVFNDHFGAANRLKVAEDFIANWPDFGRDTNVRYLNEDEVICVAGDMSWGDTPDGTGYTTLNYVYNLKLDDILGLR